MNFGLAKKYQQFDFEEVSVDQLEVVSGGTGGSFADLWSHCYDENERAWTGLGAAVGCAISAGWGVAA